MVSITRYYCDLCGEEVENSKGSGFSVMSNVIIDYGTRSDEHHHICEECLSNLNIYEVVEEIFKKQNSAPPYKDDVVSVKVDQQYKLKIKKPSVEEK